MMLALVAAEMIARSKPDELKEMDVCLHYCRRGRSGTNGMIKTRQLTRWDVL
jgi:hypothetical protein